MSFFKHVERCRNCKCELKFCVVVPDSKVERIEKEDYTMLHAERTEKGYKVLVKCSCGPALNVFEYEHDW